MLLTLLPHLDAPHSAPPPPGKRGSPGGGRSILLTPLPPGKRGSLLGSAVLPPPRGALLGFAVPTRALGSSLHLPPDPSSGPSGARTPASVSSCKAILPGWSTLPSASQPAPGARARWRTRLPSISNWMAPSSIRSPSRVKEALCPSG